MRTEHIMYNQNVAKVRLINFAFIRQPSFNSSPHATDESRLSVYQCPFICHYSPGVEIVLVAEIGTVRVHFRQGSAADAVAATGEGGDLPVAQD